MTCQQRQTPTSHCTLCSKKPTPLLPQGIDSTPHTMRLCIRCQNLHHRGPSERDTSFTFQSDNSSSRIPPSSCSLPTSRSEAVVLQQLEPRLPALALCSRKWRKWMSNFSPGHVGSNMRKRNVQKFGGITKFNKYTLLFPQCQHTLFSILKISNKNHLKFMQFFKKKPRIYIFTSWKSWSTAFKFYTHIVPSPW